MRVRLLIPFGNDGRSPTQRQNRIRRMTSRQRWKIYSVNWRKCAFMRRSLRATAGEAGHSHHAGYNSRYLRDHRQRRVTCPVTASRLQRRAGITPKSNRSWASKRSYGRSRQSNDGRANSLSDRVRGACYVCHHHGHCTRECPNSGKVFRRGGGGGRQRLLPSTALPKL